MGDKLPIVGVSVVIKKGDDFLFMRRKGKHGDGQWSFPGGKLDFGESLEECAIREVKEEVGIDIRDPKFTHLTSDIFTKEGLHFITVLMECYYTGGDIVNKEPDKCSEMMWSKIEDIPKDQMFLPLRKYYEHIWENTEYQEENTDPLELMDKKVNTNKPMSDYEKALAVLVKRDSDFTFPYGNGVTPNVREILIKNIITNSENEVNMFLPSSIFCDPQYSVIFNTIESSLKMGISVNMVIHRDGHNHENHISFLEERLLEVSKKYHRFNVKDASKEFLKCMCIDDTNDLTYFTLGDDKSFQMERSNSLTTGVCSFNRPDFVSKYKSKFESVYNTCGDYFILGKLTRGIW